MQLSTTLHVYIYTTKILHFTRKNVALLIWIKVIVSKVKERIIGLFEEV